MDLNQHDMDELRHAAWKAQATSSPHACVTVTVEAEKLLWLLDRVQEDRAMRAELDQLHEDAEECCCVRTPSDDGCPVHER